MGRTLKRFLKIATVGAEIRESGKLFQSLTTLFEKKWPANLVLVRLTNNFLECPLKSLWGREKNLSAGVLYSPLLGSFTKIRTASKIIRIYLVGKAIKIPLK